MIPIVVAGATGRTGRPVALGVHGAPDMALIGAVARHQAGLLLGPLIGEEDLDVVVQRDLQDIAAEYAVLIDFTEAKSALDRSLYAMERGWDIVLGTTGFHEQEIARLDQAVRHTGVGAALIANFSLGSFVAEKMVELVSRYYSQVEVIEAHSHSKKDQPSGTARRMADLLGVFLDKPSDSIPIHSVRLSGMVAHQRTLFGGQGEVITIGHDVHDRGAYVAGVLAATRAVGLARGRLLTDLSEIWSLVPRQSKVPPTRPTEST